MDGVRRRSRSEYPEACSSRGFALSDAALAAKIQEDEIDILVDLTEPLPEIPKCAQSRQPVG
jgi:predicted O-linked N-acetylglucosamine transferase (SPINDLY family)